MNVSELCQRVKLAANKLAGIDTETKNLVLRIAGRKLTEQADALIAANALDLAAAKANGRNAAFLDRLMLDAKRIEGMVRGLDAVIALPDPVGKVVETYKMYNGIDVTKVRAPLGVIGIIFEARPNVALDAAALCIKSGNGVVLRGSRDSRNSVCKIVDCIREALAEAGVSPDTVGLVDGPDRALTTEMLHQGQYIDVVIPRGGEGLKKVVLENAVMPVIASAGGNCHAYLAADCDPEIALTTTFNAKVSRPGVCNALETVLFDRALDKSFVRKVLDRLAEANVEIRGDAELQATYPAATLVPEEEFYREYEDLIVKAKFVDGVQEAINHINRFGTHHSDAIITSDMSKAQKFAKEVDSAAVYVNASTRFTDGFEFGLGAEMGISTQKLHVRGPIGLCELTSVKYVLNGNGQIR